MITRKSFLGRLAALIATPIVAKAIPMTELAPPIKKKVAEQTKVEMKKINDFYTDDHKGICFSGTYAYTGSYPVQFCSGIITGRF